jgi:hypothetical protein
MFDEAIAGALKTAKCMIVLWSKSSVSSAWVKDEASEGKRRGILIPAVIDDNVDIPFGFRSLQVVRLTAWQGHPDSAFRALTGAIISLLEEANKAESRAEPGAREALADISGDHLYRDPTTRLIWTAKCSQKPMDWHEAKEYAKQLRIGGFSDWRLPTVDELEELHDHLGRVKYMVPNWYYECTNRDSEDLHEVGLNVNEHAGLCDCKVAESARIVPFHGKTLRCQAQTQAIGAPCIPFLRP